MKQVSGRTFRDERVHLDNTNYINCTFERCLMVYTASGPTTMSDCTIIECRWSLEGAAGDTLGFLTSIYPFAPELLEQTFNNIRRGGHQPPPDDTPEFPDTIG